MANEDKKDFNAMLHDSKDMPKFQTITDEKSIEKYGGNKMYFAPPIDYDKVMRLVPYGKLLPVGAIREYFANENGADFTEPITAGIFVSIVAWASYQRSKDCNTLLAHLKGKWGIKRQISRRHRSSERKVGSGRTYDCPKRQEKYQILC